MVESRIFGVGCACAWWSVECSCAAHNEVPEVNQHFRGKGIHCKSISSAERSRHNPAPSRAGRRDKKSCVCPSLPPFHADRRRCGCHTARRAQAIKGARRPPPLPRELAASSRRGPHAARGLRPGSRDGSPPPGSCASLLSVRSASAWAATAPILRFASSLRTAAEHARSARSPVILGHAPRQTAAKNIHETIDAQFLLRCLLLHARLDHVLSLGNEAARPRVS